MGVYGPHTQVECLVKNLIFETSKKNILVYSQMRFHLYQKHSLTAKGIKGGKKSINLVREYFRDLKVTLKLPTDFKFSADKDYK